MSKSLGLLLLVLMALQITGFPTMRDIVKYKVPNKFFGKANSTALQGSDLLYNFLTQIHYGGISPSTAVDMNSIQVDDVSVESSSEPEADEETTANESPEATTGVIQQMDIVEHNDDSIESSLQALIEKVVNGELTKLVEEKFQLSTVPSLQTAEKTSSVALEEQEHPQSSFTTESANLDSETILPTDTPAVENEKMELETISETESLLQKHDKVSEEIDFVMPSTTTETQEDVTDEISDSLLNAVGDLLSSILGLETALSVAEKPTVDDHSGEKEKTDNENIDSNAVLKETAASSTEPESTSTISFETETLNLVKSDEMTEGVTNNERESEATSETVPLKISHVNFNTAVKSDGISEVDVKIENLAKAQTSFVTESVEQLIEIAKEEPIEETKFNPEVLEVISDEEKPVSFEESVNQIMNLVKGDEGRLALRESILKDKIMKQDEEDLDQIVYGTLKELEANFGMNQAISFEPIEMHRENLIKQIESEIRESTRQKSQIEDENFLPNSAKAAMFYKQRGDVDF